MKEHTPKRVGNRGFPRMLSVNRLTTAHWMWARPLASTARVLSTRYSSTSSATMWPREVPT